MSWIEAGEVMTLHMVSEEPRASARGILAFSRKHVEGTVKSFMKTEAARMKPQRTLSNARGKI